MDLIFSISTTNCWICNKTKKKIQIVKLENMNYKNYICKINKLKNKQNISHLTF